MTCCSVITGFCGLWTRKCNGFFAADALLYAEFLLQLSCIQIIVAKQNPLIPIMSFYCLLCWFTVWSLVTLLLLMDQHVLFLGWTLYMGLLFVCDQFVICSCLVLFYWVMFSFFNVGKHASEMTFLDVDWEVKVGLKQSLYCIYLVKFTADVHLRNAQNSSHFSFVAVNDQFLPCDAMLTQYMLWPCVHLSQVRVLLKWLNVGLRKQRHTIAQTL